MPPWPAGMTGIQLHQHVVDAALLLPALQGEVVAAVAAHLVLVISGATGCGKSTQVGAQWWGCTVVGVGARAAVVECTEGGSSGGG